MLYWKLWAKLLEVDWFCLLAKLSSSPLVLSRHRVRSSFNLSTTSGFAFSMYLFLQRLLITSWILLATIYSLLTSICLTFSMWLIISAELWLFWYYSECTRFVNLTASLESKLSTLSTSLSPELAFLFPSSASSLLFSLTFLSAANINNNDSSRVHLS